MTASLLAAHFAQATNAVLAAPKPTGIDWIDNILNGAPVVIVALAIQALSIALAKTDWFKDKYVTLVTIVLGGMFYPPTIGTWNTRNILIGIIAGFASNEITRRIVPTFSPAPPIPPTSDPKPQ